MCVHTLAVLIILKSLFQLHTAFEKEIVTENWSKSLNLVTKVVSSPMSDIMTDRQTVFELSGYNCNHKRSLPCRPI